MSLVVPAPKPDAATEPAIKNTHFWPDINPVELRDTLRLEGTVTAKRLRAVIKYALTEVNAELYNYRVALCDRAALMKVYAEQGDTVDSLCWRYYGRTESVMEQVYAANVGLAARGAILPHGYAVELPDIIQAAVSETVSLWD